MFSHVRLFKGIISLLPIIQLLCIYLSLFLFLFLFLFYFCVFIFVLLFTFPFQTCVLCRICNCILYLCYFFIIIIIFLLDLFHRNLRANISSFILFFSRIYKKTGFKFYFTNLYYFITNIWLNLLFHFYPIFLFVASKLEENEPWTTPKHDALVHIIVLTS